METSNVVIEGMEQWDSQQGAPRMMLGMCIFKRRKGFVFFNFHTNALVRGRICLHDVSENEFFSNTFQKIQNAKEAERDKIRSF